MDDTGKKTCVDTHRDDDGELLLVFGAGTTVDDLRIALDGLPGGAELFHLHATWHCGADDCDGSDLPPHLSDDPDEEHHYVVMTLAFDQPELPETVTVPDSPEGLA